MFTQLEKQIDQVQEFASQNGINFNPGHDTLLEVEPDTVQKLSEITALCNELGLKMAPIGSGSKSQWGNVPDEINILLSTRKLNKMIEHAWGDMTATFQAGCTLGEVQQSLALHGQRLPLDPLWPDRATLGGIVSTADTGALQLKFGGVRDLLLGITVVLVDGTIARSGGKVVKNVAGYDLSKLYTGSFGTLGVISEITFRLYPVPRDTVTVSLKTDDVEYLNDLILKILASHLVPSGIQALIESSGETRLDLIFEGEFESNEDQVFQLRNLAGEGFSQNETGVWKERNSLFNSQGEAVVCRIGILPAQLSWLVPLLKTTFHDQPWRLLFYGTGISYLCITDAEESSVDRIKRLRNEIQKSGGYLVVLTAPSQLKILVDSWGYNGNALPLMRRIKENFDPKAALNPGRFVGGI
jgi:glycolate oxidase FAD binding subunit